MHAGSKSCSKKKYKILNYIYDKGRNIQIKMLKKFGIMKLRFREMKQEELMALTREIDNEVNKLFGNNKHKSINKTSLCPCSCNKELYHYNNH